jgi:hypothetical protein
MMGLMACMGEVVTLRDWNSGPPVVQPVASRCTGQAIPAYSQSVIVLNLVEICAANWNCWEKGNIYRSNLAALCRENSLSAAAGTPSLVRRRLSWIPARTSRWELICSLGLKQKVGRSWLVKSHVLEEWH